MATPLSWPPLPGCVTAARTGRSRRPPARSRSPTTCGAAGRRRASPPRLLSSQRFPAVSEAVNAVNAKHAITQINNAVISGFLRCGRFVSARPLSTGREAAVLLSEPFRPLKATYHSRLMFESCSCGGLGPLRRKPEGCFHLTSKPDSKSLRSPRSCLD